jgi:hypothetical protein
MIAPRWMTIPRWKEYLKLLTLNVAIGVAAVIVAPWVGVLINRYWEWVYWLFDRGHV